MATIDKKVYTYADYADLPVGAPYELIGGDLIMTPAPTPFHQIVAKRFHRLLLMLEDRGLGQVISAPIDVYFSETETYQPDLIFIARDRYAIIGDQHIEDAPDLIVEILSPSTAYYDLRHKMRVYEQSGVKEYWIVDPIERTVELFGENEGRWSLIQSSVRSGSVRSRLYDSLEVVDVTIFAPIEG